MFLFIICAILAGVTAGIFTGLIPGLHVNLITVVVLSLGATMAGISPLILAVFIISLSLTHSFLDSIPSVYLGAPDESQVVAVLPGHQLFLEGKGHFAIVYTLVGSLGALLLTILFIPIGWKILVPVANVISPIVGKLLLGVVVLLLVLSGKIIRNALFFIAAGFLGLLCFDLVSQQHILLPLLSGLFGVSTLLFSVLGQEAAVRKTQKCSASIPLQRASIEKTVSRATFVGVLASFLPGFGSSQAAIMASATMKKKTPQDYLLLVGGINTVNFSFSLITLLLLDKARNGAVVGIRDLFASQGVALSVSHLAVFIPVLLGVGGIATMLGLKLSKMTAVVLQRVEYATVVWVVICFLIAMVLLLSGLQGGLILLISTALGVLAGLCGAQKNMLLGCLLLPVIFYLW